MSVLQAIYDSIDPVAFTIGPLQVRWYGLAYLAGFVLCAWIAYRIAKRWKVPLDLDKLLVLLIAIMLGVVIGARLGYVLFYGNGYYLQHPLEIFAFQNGGMSFHGGLIGMVIGGLVTSRIIKIDFITLADIVVVSVPVALFLGRLANFVNGELWGAVTDLPWGVVFESGGDLPRHPTQLYEAMLEGVVMFVVLYLMARRKPPFPRGTYIGMFMVLYGVFRILIEFVRQPDAQLGYLAGGWLTMGMVLSIPVVLAGVGFLLYARKTRRPQVDEGNDGAAAAS